MIRIVCVGRLKEKAMVSMVEEYKKRILPIQKVEVVELANSTYKDSDPHSIIKDESQRLLSKIDERDYVVLLDLKGKMLDSPGLAQLCETGVSSGKNLTFVIGGSHGVDQSIRDRADYRWKLSDLTFPHQLVRVILMEQIYRGLMILRNHPYHK